MRCWLYRKLLIPYSEDALDGRTRERVDRHLAGCEQCRTDLAAIRSVAGALMNAPGPAVEPASDLWARVSERIAAEAPRQPVRRSWLRAPQAISAAAAAVLVVAVGVTIMRSGMLTENVAMAPRSVNLGPTERAYGNEKMARAPLAQSMQPAEGDRLAMGVGADKRRTPTSGAGEPARRKIELAPPPPPRMDDRVAFATPRPARMPGRLYDAPGGFKVLDESRARPAPAAPAAAPGHDSYAGSAAAPGSVRSDGGDAASETVDGHAVDSVSVASVVARPEVALGGCAAASATVLYADTAAGDSVVDALNETEGVRTAALFTYP